MTSQWTRYLSLRYLFTHNGRKGHLGNTLAILGLTIGIMTLLTVLTVMNGFQQGFITSINEIYSYHIRAAVDGGEAPSFNIKGVRASVPFLDHQGILTIGQAVSSGGQLRQLDFQAAESDRKFLEVLNIIEGHIPSNDHELILGSDLARYLASEVGDKITFSFLGLVGNNFENRAYTVSGIFRTGYYEYDRNMAFSSLQDFSGQPYTVGIKLNNHFKDGSIIRKLEDLFPEYSFVSWRQYNSAFYNALRIEKIFMFLIVALIFIVVSVNIYHSMKRNVKERINELALLKAIGGTPPDIIRIYTYQGLLISLISTLAGTLLGVILCLNINEIISLFLDIQLKFSNLISSLNHGELTLPGQYYFMEIPVKFLWQDILTINLTAYLTVFTAAYTSVRKASKILPAEIFRNE